MKTPIRQTKPAYNKPPIGSKPPMNYILPTPVKNPKQQSLDAINRRLKG